MPQHLDYSDIAGQESMIKDRIRCEAFQRAITEAVKPDAVVLDIGAGTGLLSMFAAQAGARKVYAVERTAIAETARLLIEENGLSDRIEVIQNDIDAVDLPEQVDVIVSEWLGGYALDENLLPIVIRARDRWLRPGGAMIPQSVVSIMVPAHDTLHQQDVDFWNSYPYGLEMGSIAVARTEQAYVGRYDLSADRVNCTPAVMWSIDCETCAIEDAERVYEATLTFTMDRDAPVNALAAWFDAQLSDGVRLCNGPSDPETHWGRCVFPIGQCLDVAAGSEVGVTFTHRPIGPGTSAAQWSVAIGDYAFESNDSTSLGRD